MTLAKQLSSVHGIVIEHFGDWRDAKFATLPQRMPRNGELLIETEACALNFHDLLLIEGKYQAKPEVPFFPGSDAVGRVVAVGPGVQAFEVGQRVASVSLFGAFAELVIASANRCFPIPDDIDASEAAACGTVFSTVVVALSIRGQLKSGDQLLITGGSGGVGIAAIQYARKIGANVVALVSSERKESLARRAGAHNVLRIDQMSNPRDDMRESLMRQVGGGVDVVLDVVGGDVFDAALRCLNQRGRLIVVGFASGKIASLKTSYLLLKNLSVIGATLESGFERDGEALRATMGQIYKGVVSKEYDAFISQRFPLEHFHNAAEQIATRNVAGKIVLLPNVKETICPRS